MSKPVNARRGPTFFEDLLAELLWPKLLRAVSLAGRPQRLLLAFFLVVIVGALGQIRMPWAVEGSPPFLDALVGATSRAFQLILSGLAGADLGVTLAGFAALAHDVPRLLATGYPFATVLLGIPILLATAVLGGAVCRSVATEFGQEIVHPWTRTLAFAVARWLTFAGVLLLPAIALGLMALLLAVAGLAFWVPVLDLLGALLFGAALVVGLGAALLLVLSVLAAPMLLPAGACEGTDAIDAVQRAIAYAFARPLRLAWYLFVAALIGVLAVGVVWGLAEGADRFARAAAASWTGPSGTAALTGEFPPDAALDGAGEPRELRGSAAGAARIVNLWSSILATLVAAYAVSYALAAGTLVYLFMREVCDGQHHTELWTPGLVESSLEASMRRTGEAGAPSGVLDDEDGPED